MKFWLWLVLMAVGGCGTLKTECSDTCTGCCTEAGECVSGTTNAQCGRKGELCNACVSSCRQSSYCSDMFQTCVNIPDTDYCSRDGGP